MANWTESLNKEEAKTDLDSGIRLPARGLEAAYSDDEPEYTLDMLISVNPDYAGLDENGEISMRVPACGLEAAYGDDEPEYTLDMLISVNPDYDEKQTHRRTRCNFGCKGVVRKTGTLSGVSALAGYTTTANSEVVAFGILISHYVGSATSARDIQDQIGGYLTGFSHHSVSNVNGKFTQGKQKQFERVVNFIAIGLFAWYNN